MAFIITWKPVLQPIALREYHEEYGKDTVQVCVNAPRDFMEERNALIRKNSELTAAYRKGDPADLEQRSKEYLEWFVGTFLPEIDDWFARLWSYGADKWTVADLKQIGETDAHLLEWLKTRSVEMITDHARGIKKN